MQSSFYYLIYPVDVNEVISIIKDLKSSPSAGPDGIPTSVIKAAASHIGHVLSYLINCIFSTGIFPDQLKQAKVIPIYKNADHSQFTNYRPISILNIFSKIVEKAIYKRLLSFVTKFNILSNDHLALDQDFPLICPFCLC